MGKVRLAFAAAAIIAACGKGETGNESGAYDVILKHGWVVDGSGNPRYRGDVALRGDRIAAVGFLAGAQARETLDVAGLVVSPGFIDMMGQSEINALIDNRVFSKITQGITTEVTGEGGSVAPLTDQLVLDDSDAMKKWHYREDWRDLDGYFAQLAKQGAALNIATFVGATQVRLAVVGKANRAPTAAELARMTALVDTLMEQGALGLWTALEYAPASYSKTDELIALAKAARRHGGIYASHMRNEGVRIDDALNELFQIARDAEIPAEVSHLKVSGRKSWGQMPRIVARIDSARAAGLDVTADQYPYTRAATALDASIPSWAESGGWDSLLARLRDPATRARLHDEMVNPKATESFYYEAGGGDGVLITGTFQDSLRYLQGKTVGEIAAQRHRDPVETLFDIVLAEHGHRTDAVYAVMSEPDVQTAMKTWWLAVNTDFGGVAPDGPFGTQSAHPRAYGTFARILGHYARDLKLFPLEFAVRKMTALAAQRVGLSDRGLLKAGMAADITVFDPVTVADKATFEQPHQPSVGFAYVFVNGQKVLDHGKLTAARPGRGLRGPGYVPPGARGTK
jgi:N-acyl-D-amino-acid deacylase